MEISFRDLTMLLHSKHLKNWLPTIDNVLIRCSLCILTRYTANHGGIAFKCLVCLLLYDGTIPDNATTVLCVHAESSHCTCLDNYASYKAAKHGVSKFLSDKTTNEVWYNNLKDADTFYAKVLDLEIMTFLDTNSRGFTPST